MKEYGENERKIAEFVYKEMCDGCCIQIGTGGVPTAIAALLAESDLKDLGVHTELLSDSIMMLEQKGLITGAKKSIQKGLMTTSILNGTAEFMEYVKENREKFYMAPSDYVNDPHVVGQLDDFISVNGILEIDLQGHVNSESIQTRQISGTGGQLDFVMGAYRSKGGKSILCCNSTYRKKDGTVASKIHATLPEGASCTVPRAAVQYVCTEQGIVDLKGKNIWDRAELLISIAHPDFRDGLVAEAERLGIWRPSNRR
ncbi:acetyl-CoA hydrolase/transferase family protein [uncultured Intestinimonas sp.]|uniref:acetyl-CoA hydrolase/transferase family protein n=1 Tax=uncultured Intestinimonas sp. TaxID=1689265 RepID=UPI0026370D00|nr:acetyl-CoA hydrolase/transferase C-terminal domain-containing protein [uncultured Intestinimonas sp.]